MSVEIHAPPRTRSILAVVSIAAMACVPPLVAQDKRTGNNPEKSGHNASGPTESKREKATNSMSERTTDSKEGRIIERRDGRETDADSKDRRVTKPDAGERKALEQKSKDLSLIHI